jgi:hypothetical protein
MSSKVVRHSSPCMCLKLLQLCKFKRSKQLVVAKDGILASLGQSLKLSCSKLDGNTSTVDSSGHPSIDRLTNHFRFPMVWGRVVMVAWYDKSSFLSAARAPKSTMSMDPLRARRRVSDWSPCKVSGKLPRPRNLSEVRDESNPNSAGRSLTFVLSTTNFLNILSPPIDAGSADRELQPETESVSRLVSVPNSSGSCCRSGQDGKTSVLRLTNPTTLSGKVLNPPE